MIGFIRRNIPGMSCEALISRLNYDIAMKKIALDVASGGSHSRKCKSYSYYDTNERLLTEEAERRHARGERVMWKYGKWRTIDDAYEMMQKEKKQHEARIKDAVENITLSEDQRHDIITDYRIDIDYVDIMIREVRLKYM